MDWLEEPVCQPPCFLGITPGTTTLDEARRLLSSRHDVHILENPLDSQYHHELIWDFSTNTPDEGGRLDTFDDGDTVSFIQLSLGRGQYLPLAEVIESFDTPEHVSLYDCRGSVCVVHLIYGSGTVLEAFMPAKMDPGKNTHSIEITPDTGIEDIWFLTPGEDGYRESFGEFSNYLSGTSPLWTGYTTYTEK